MSMHPFVLRAASLGAVVAACIAAAVMAINPYLWVFGIFTGIAILIAGAPIASFVWLNSAKPTVARIFVVAYACTVVALVWWRPVGDMTWWTVAAVSAALGGAVVCACALTVLTRSRVRLPEAAFFAVALLLHLLVPGVYATYRDAFEGGRSLQEIDLAVSGVKGAKVTLRIPAAYLDSADQRIGPRPPLVRSVAADNTRVEAAFPSGRPWRLRLAEDRYPIVVRFSTRSYPRGCSEGDSRCRARYLENRSPGELVATTEGLTGLKEEERASSRSYWKPESTKSVDFVCSYVRSSPHPGCVGFGIAGDITIIFHFDTSYLQEWQDIENSASLLMERFIVK